MIALIVMGMLGIRQYVEKKGCTAKVIEDKMLVKVSAGFAIGFLLFIIFHGKYILAYFITHGENIDTALLLSPVIYLIMSVSFWMLLFFVADLASAVKYREVQTRVCKNCQKDCAIKVTSSQMQAYDSVEDRRKRTAIARAQRKQEQLRREAKLKARKQKRERKSNLKK